MQTTQLNKNNQIIHLLDIKTLPLSEINYLFNLAEKISRKNIQSDCLLHKQVINLFYEPSTRTRVSFETAAKQLSASVINIDINFSSVTKGESLLDTFKTIEATGVNIVVIRHPSNGAAHFLAENCPDGVAIINAGDGIQNHPSQALLDLYTIKQYKSRLDDLKIVIVGDVKHSRVAQSLIQLLTLMQAGEIHVVAPKELLPKHQDIKHASLSSNFNKTIKGADVVYMLRIQRERVKQNLSLSKNDYFKHFGLTLDRLALAKPDSLVMHPGPFNRGVEISDEVVSHPRSLIFEQIKNGVLIRKAIFMRLCESMKN